MRRLGSLLALMLFSAPLFSETFLEQTLSLDPYPAFPLEERFDDPEAEFRDKLSRLLNDTALLFSFMIYGTDFSYTPENPERSIKETLSYSLIRSIPWGDASLSAYQTWKEDGLYRIRFIYRLSAYEETALEQRRQLGDIKARGLAPLEEDQPLRLALEEALKNALRDYCRNEPVLPKEIRGRAFVECPIGQGFQANQYFVTANWALDIRKIIPQTFY